MGAWPVKPPLGAAIDPASPYARGLLLYLPFVEGTGAPCDYALRRTTVRQNAPRWVGSPVGPAMSFVGASTQRLDWGAVPSLSAIPRLTIELRGRRVAGEGFLVGRGASNATALHFGYRNSTDVFFRVGTGAAGADGEFAHSDANWHTLTGVFDGTQTGNAARLKIYLDGVPQTLSFTGTIPAVTPTSTASFYANFIQSVSTYYNGTCASLAIWSRAFTLAEIQERERDSWAPFAPERAAEGAVGGEPPPVVTATASNPQPADDATHTDPGGAVSIDWTPSDALLNPLDTITLTINGISYTPALTSIGSGGLRASVAAPILRANQINTASSTATTDDANLNGPFAWTWTPRRTYRADLLAEYALPPTVATHAPVDWAAQLTAPAPALVDYAIRDTGAASATVNAAEYSVLDRADGFRSALVNVIDYWVLDAARQILALASATIAERGASDVPTSADVLATAHERLATGAALYGQTRHLLVLASAALARHERARFAAAMVLAARGTSGFATSADLPPWLVGMLWRVVVRSEFQQGVEETP
jgi:hypothetical protein